MERAIRRYVESCAGCTFTHPSMLFIELAPDEIFHSGPEDKKYTHWSPCHESGKIIYLFDPSFTEVTVK